MASNASAPWTSIKLVKSNTPRSLGLRPWRLSHLEYDVALIFAGMIRFRQTIKEALSLYQAWPLVKKIDLGSFGRDDDVVLMWRLWWCSIAGDNISLQEFPMLRMRGNFRLSAVRLRADG